VRGRVLRSWFAPAALLPTVVAVALLVVVWAATTGPIGVMSPSGRTLPVPSPRRGSSGSAEPTSEPNIRELTEDVKLKLDLSWLGDLIAWSLVIGVVVAAVFGVRHLWVHRWHRPPKPVETEFEVLPDQALAEALRQDLETQVAAVDHGTPRDGIVACWLRMVEVITEAGVRPRRSDTAAEFAVRVLHALDVDPRAVGLLAALYREARFSPHEMGETEREQARQALRDVHETLGDRPVST
jgi:Domain of unknown function (DUF4129)